MGVNEKYIIKYGGLSSGFHDFKFDIDESFFESFVEKEEGYKINGFANVKLEKRSTMMVVDVSLDIEWETDCDTCGEDMFLEIDSNNTFYVKFGNEETDNEDVLILPQNEHEFSIAPNIYEYALTSLPLKKTHVDGDCNQDIISELNKLKPNQNDNDSKNNPMWDKLKDLS